MINKNTLLKIKKIALKIDHDISFSGKSKGNRHLFRVVEIAKFLAKKTEADLSIIIAGAFLHDTALPFGNDDSYLKNKEVVINLLKDFDIKQNDKKNIAECVTIASNRTRYEKIIPHKIREQGSQKEWRDLKFRSN